MNQIKAKSVPANTVPGTDAVTFDVGETNGYVRFHIIAKGVGILTESRVNYLTPADARELARLLNVQASIAEGYRHA